MAVAKFTPTLQNMSTLQLLLTSVFMRRSFKKLLQKLRSTYASSQGQNVPRTQTYTNAVGKHFQLHYSFTVRCINLVYRMHTYKF